MGLGKGSSVFFRRRPCKPWKKREIGSRGGERERERERKRKKDELGLSAARKIATIVGNGEEGIGLREEEGKRGELPRMPNGSP